VCVCVWDNDDNIAHPPMLEIVGPTCKRMALDGGMI